MNESIGNIVSLENDVIVIRDGVTISLTEGDEILQQDEIVTTEGSVVTIQFTDESIFSMSDSGSMIIDEMIYDPAEQMGSMTLEIGHGVATFVSGMIAKSDPNAMLIETPVATIGIRGTKVGVDVATDGITRVVLLEEHDGFVGEIVISTSVDVQVINRANMSTTISYGDIVLSDPILMTDVLIDSIYGNSLLRANEAVKFLDDVIPELDENNNLLYETQTGFDEFVTDAGGDEYDEDFTNIVDERINNVVNTYGAIDPISEISETVTPDVEIFTDDKNENDEIINLNIFPEPVPTPTPEPTSEPVPTPTPTPEPTSEPVPILVLDPVRIDKNNFDDIDSGFRVVGRDIDGEIAEDNVVVSSGALGVSGAVIGNVVPNQIGHNPVTGEAEGIIVEFDNNVTQVEFGVSRLYKNEGDGRGSSGDEQGKVILYRNDEIVGEVEFTAQQRHTGTFTVQADDGGTFDTIEFTATDYSDDDANQTGDSSDYLVTQITYTPVAPDENEFDINDIICGDDEMNFPDDENQEIINGNNSNGNDSGVSGDSYTTTDNFQNGTVIDFE